MIRRVNVCLLLTVLLFTVSHAQAQQPKKVSRIGFLNDASPSSLAARIEAFRQGLRNLGYVEGQNVAIEYRFAEGKPDRLPELAAELVRLNVDVIFAPSTTGVQAAKQVTLTIPIVMALAGDPIGSGFVASLARPGGNITGLTSLFGELSAKRLELLKEAIPRVNRVTVLANPALPFHSSMMTPLEEAARTLKVQLQIAEVRDPRDLENAFSATRRERANGLLVLPNPMNFLQRKNIADLAIKNRLPSMFIAREYAEGGGLMSYGADNPDLYRRAATYVDKILKGAKPADLPVEQPTKFDFVINLKTAKALNLTIPQSVLFRADKVIR